VRYSPFGDRAPVTFALCFLLVAGLALAVSGDDPLLPGDRLAAEAAESVHGPWLTERMRALTDLGSGVLVAVVLVFASLGLAANRKWNELAITVTGALIIALGVPELKDGIGRARPDDGLVSSESLAYPSGHAAHATVYVYLAVLIAHLSPESRRLGLLFAVTIALCLAIGLSRVYLGAHYLSDVVGGWAFGVGAFCFWAVFSLARDRLRHNLARE